MALNLKSEIDRLNTNKEKTKKVKENINTKLVEYGSTQANTLAEVPDKLAELAKKYKKVGILDLNQKMHFNSNGRQRISFRMNLDFTPKECYIAFSQTLKDLIGSASLVNAGMYLAPGSQKKILLNTRRYWLFSDASITRTKLTFTLDSSLSDITDKEFIFTKIVALG